MALERKWQWTKHLLQQDENIRGETFEWNIPRFFLNGNKLIKSLEFKWGKYTCSLNIHGAVSGTVFNIYLRYNDVSFPKNVHFYKLSLINHQRQIFLSACGNKFSNNSRSDIHLMRFCTNHLLNNSDTTLTVCLSLNAWKDKGAYEKETQTTLDLNPDEGQLKLLENMSKDFGRFYKSKINTDCVLKVGNADFLAHRAVLSARSSVFADLFSHGSNESSSGIVSILDVDEVVVGDVLYFIYSGQIRGLTPDAAALMYAVAKKFGLFDLKEVCLHFLKRSLKIGNICDAALLAENYSETELQEEVVQFIKGKLEEVKQSVEWKILTHYKPLLTTKLLYSAAIAYKEKNLASE